VESVGSIPSGWALRKEKSGYTGDGYLVWEGSDNMSAPGKGLLTYKIQINKAGIYRLQWHNTITVGSESSEHNDSWVRFPDADDFFASKLNLQSRLYPKGSGKTPVVDGAGANGWLKVHTSLFRW